MNMKANVWTAIIGALITTIGGIIIAYMQFHQPSPQQDKIFAISGYVKNAKTHMAVAGATVVIELNGSPIQVQTDDGGHYDFNLKSGEPTLNIRRKINASGYVSIDEEVNIPSGSQGDLLLMPIVLKSGFTGTTIVPGITTSASSNNSFEGQWVNLNPHTTTITKMSIGSRGSQMVIHAWGKCEPTDCDWGTQAGLLVGQTLTVNWNQGFVNRKMTFTKRGDNTFMVMGDSVYTDGRPTQHWIETFVRGTR
jgi:hypothetical protein